MEALTNIFSKQIPQYLIPYMNSNALQRLKNVSMNCGVNYTSLPLFKNIPYYSRFEHSLNVALILDNFCHDKKIALSGLFHDISTPAFSHTIDFLNGDYDSQESYEVSNDFFIQHDSSIISQLKIDNIRLNEVNDYKIYPLADNPSPRLSSDRLEYTLSNGYYYGFIDKNTVEKMYRNLTIIHNEEGKEEFAFLDKSVAEEFCLLSIQCGRVYCSKEDRYAMEILAKLIKEAMLFHILDMKDLYLSEDSIIQKLEHSHLSQKWDQFIQLKKVNSFKEHIPCSLQINSKKRFINPMWIDGKRVYESSAIIKHEIDAFSKEDFNAYLKGE